MANTPNQSRFSAALFQPLVTAMVAGWFLLAPARGQVFTMTREQLIKYTAKSPYERFPDGRPKVPDALLEKFKDMSSEEIGLARSGFPNQFVGSLQVLHPEKKLIGRAVTLQLMPLRPDIAEVDAAEWKAQGHQRPRDHQTALDLLQPGDVIVVDVFGSVASGGVIGDNLAFFIMTTTKAGFVIDGAIRDLDGISPLDLAGYFRGATPPAIHNVMVAGINIPVRIGDTTVMPGDVVFGDREGVSFIPPHLVQGIVDEAQITHLHDDWTKMKFAQGKYKSTDIYSRPRDPELLKEYEDYLKQKLSPGAYEEYLKTRPSVRP
ncbi:MAG: dimethylmenaquinone methyltransferase [Bryobacteraceae bacterium]|jgi:regulator of RNase E activity RraA